MIEKYGMEALRIKETIDEIKNERNGTRENVVFKYSVFMF